MWGTLLLLIAGVTGSWAADYELLLEDPDIFSPCTEPPPGSSNIHGLFNLDNLVLDQEADVIHLSENVTTTWDVQPSDRISARFAIMHYERGNWEPSIFSLATPDFCAKMFDEGSYWFKDWTAFIINREEIEKKCLKTRGTVLVHKPFDFQLRLLNISGPTFQGRYKVVVTFEAFDKMDVPRRNTICFEIRGDIEKIKK